MKDANTKTSTQQEHQDKDEATTTTDTTVDDGDSSKLNLVWFIFKILSVCFSYRVVFLFAPNILNDDKDGEKKSFKQNVDSNFYSLFSDSICVFMFFTTCILFFWRAKSLIKSLKSSEYSEWKSLIWAEFYGGGIEFGAFMLLLLLKWPVIFSYYWYKGTEQEDKSTWAQMFMREFSPKGPNREKDEKLNPDIFFPPSHPDYPRQSASSASGASSTGKGKVTDEEWRRTFRRDMQNIGFEFDQNGEITKFPPTEVMEQYQKSERFRDLMFMADSIGQPIIEKQSSSSNSSSSMPSIVKPTSTTTTTTTTTASKKKGKKNK